MMLIVTVALLTLPADRIVLKMVANVPVQTYTEDDVFVLDSDRKNVTVEVIGAEEISKDTYRATEDNVTLRLTKTN
jgi:hypothetical protein